MGGRGWPHRSGSPVSWTAQERARWQRRRRFGLRRRLAGAFALVAVLAVTLTAWLTFRAGWQAIVALDPSLAAGTNWDSPAWQNGPPSAVRTAFREFGRSAVQAGVLASLLAVFLSAGVARQLTRPLSRLEDAAGRLASGERGVRLPLPLAQDELLTLTEAFNTLTQSLERQEAWRRALVADVAHDLRTPLAVLRAEIEALQDGLNQPDAATLARLLAEVLLLARLVDDLRTLSLAEGGALPMHPQTLDAAATMRQVADLYAGRARAAGSALTPDLPPSPLPVTADPDRLMQVLHNLLDNALRYAAPADIELGAARAAGGVRLWVRDHGPGFAPEALARAFERFYRADASRSRDPLGRAGSPWAGPAAAWAWPSPAR